MKIILKVIRIIVISIFSVCVIGLGLIKIVSSTALNKNYIISKLDETDFYKKTYELAESNFENYIYQSGLDPVVLENICSEEKVRKDANTIISNIYDGTNTQIDVTDIAQKLDENIDKLGVKSKNNEKAIAKFIDIICDEYKDTILHTSKEGKIHDMYNKVNSLVKVVSLALIVVMVISLVILVVLSLSDILALLKYIATALFVNGFFNIAVLMVIDKRMTVENIKIFTDGFTTSLVTILKDILSKVEVFSIVSIVIALVLVITYGFIKKDKENK